MIHGAYRGPALFMSDYLPIEKADSIVPKNRIPV